MVTINFFRTVRSILDDFVDNYCATTGRSRLLVYFRARRFVRDNRDAYFTAEGRLDYQDPLCRLAYLYAYVPAHANLIDHAFQKFRRLRDMLEEHMDSGGTFRICSLGGGPGSELLGVAKCAERAAAGRTLELQFTLVDNVTEWDETWHALHTDVENQLEEAYGLARNSWPVRISHSFLPLDLSDQTSFAQMPTRFVNIDVFILNFVVSELIESADGLAETLTWLAERTSSDAYFLFIDRVEDRIWRRIDEILRLAGLTATRQLEQNTIMDYDEQTSDLEDWPDRLDWIPKVRLRARHMLATREEGTKDEDIPF